MGVSNTPAYFYIHASVTQAPSATVPNGVVTMNMAVTPVAGGPLSRPLGPGHANESVTHTIGRSMTEFRLNLQTYKIARP
jgi:hypothetical protein